MKYLIDTFCDNGYNANTYLISNETSCIIIDPANNIKTLLKFIGQKKISGILLTHGHYDHFKELSNLLKLVDTKVYMHKMAYPKLTDLNLSCANLFMVRKLEDIPFDNVVFVSDDCKLKIDDFIVVCKHLPGHSNCSMAYIFDHNVFIGDVLFYESIGRYDLPTGNYSTLRESLNKIKKYNTDYMIYPGHDRNFELKSCLDINYYLKKLN